MRRTWVDTSEGRFCAAVVEPDSNTGSQIETALYLHGFPDQPETAEPLFRALARRGYRVIAPFLRGYAPSPLEGPFALEQLTRDVVAILSALDHRAPVRVLGHDWGAVITYALCASAPERVRSAVTMAVPHPLRFVRSLATPRQLQKSWYMLFFQLPGAPELATSALDFALIDRLWRDWSPGYALPARERRALHECLRKSRSAPLEYYRAMTRPPLAALRRLRGPMAARIATPTLHLQGAADGCIDVASCIDSERHFAGPFETRVIEGAGHFLPHERPEQLAEIAHEWFATTAAQH
ncbi:MAG: alpha/beta fold hydrolase [Polyangiales bacterium]